MKRIECVQGSPEWWAARAGRPTASNFGRIVTPAQGKPAAAQDSYIAELVAETVGWRKDEFAGSPDIERGVRMEGEARRFLAMQLGQDIEEVGFLVSPCGRYGGSPDGLTGDGIPIELKCPRLDTLIGYHMSGVLPPNYKCQVHGQMILAGSDHSWFMAYADNESIDHFLLRVERDDFTEKLASELDAFCDRLDEAKRKYITDPAYY
jgi:hypothetical protein